MNKFHFIPSLENILDIKFMLPVLKRVMRQNHLELYWKNIEKAKDHFYNPRYNYYFNQHSKLRITN